MEGIFSKEEAEVVARLAMGRIFRILSRPFQDGDVKQYEDARAAFLDSMDALGRRLTPAHINYIRGRNKGSQGD